MAWEAVEHAAPQTPVCKIHPSHCRTGGNTDSFEVSGKTSEIHLEFQWNL